MVRALVVGLGLLAASRASASDGEKLFWQVFNGGQHARIGEVVAALEKDAVAHPDEARTFLLLGVTHTWRLAEPALTGMRDPAAEAKAALEAFGRYRKMQPDDARVATWEAPVLFGAGDGLRAAAAHVPPGGQRDAMLAKAEQSLQAARASIDDGVRRQPRFNLFGRFILDAQAPPGSERLRHAAIDVAELHRLRLAGRLDEKRPDVAPLLTGEKSCGTESTFHTDPRCWNTSKTPFAFQGFWLFAGDVLLKNGEVARARQLYENAQKLPNYREWPFRSFLEDHLANAAAYAKRLADADPGNDPELAFVARAQCMMCHRTR